MHEKEYPLDIVPLFIVPGAEAAKVEAIQQQHEILVGKSKKITEENILQVNDFLETIAQAGAIIRNPEFRSQLRALIRYWSSFVNEKTQHLPIIELQPFNASQAEEITASFFTEALETVTADAKLLLAYKNRLESMRDLFLYEMDYREITSRNIDHWEKELRDIIGGIKRLRDAPYISFLLVSRDGIQAMIWNTINNLYIASDILQKKNPTVRDRQAVYQKLSELPGFLAAAIEQFTIDKETSEKIQSFNQYPEQLA